MTTTLKARLRQLPGPSQLRRFSVQLHGPERASAVRAVVDGVVVAWTLRRRSVRPLVAGMRADRSVADVERCRRVARAVDAGLALLPLAPTCLRRSLTLARELDRLDLEGAVHIGVRDVDGRVEAHAWIQVGTDVVNDDSALVATYTEIASGELERLAPVVR